MKKLIMMMALAGAVSAFAAQNDPLIPAHVEAGETYALLCKGEVVRNYMANATMDMNFQGDATLSDNAADWSVSLLALSAVDQEGGKGMGNDVSTQEVPTYDETSEITSFSTVGPDCYTDGKTPVKDNEIYLLVRRASSAEGTFKGLTWDCQTVDSADEVVKILAKASGGKCPDTPFGVVFEEGFNYQVVVLDTRNPDTGVPVEGIASPQGVDVPELVCGWAEIALDPENKQVLVWHAVKIDETAFNHSFAFNPTPLLADDCAAIYGSADENDTSWWVFPYPKAYVDSTENQTLTVGGNYWALRHPQDAAETFTLESTYSFRAFKDAEEEEVVTNAIGTLRSVDVAHLNPTIVYTDDPDKQRIFLEWYMRAVPFFQWNADFEVSFDDAVAADSVILAGSYPFKEMWPQYAFEGAGSSTWAGSSTRFDLDRNQAIRLLTEGYAAKGVHMTYAEICTKVKTFLCGVYNCKSENWGKTITVKLNIYQTKRDENGDLVETGVKHTVGTYRYTFKGPLNVAFNPSEDQGTVVKGSVVMPQALDVTYDGTSSFPLPVPEYDKAQNESVAFIGWSNRAEKVFMTMIPAGTWADADHKIQLYAVWQKAQTVQVGVKKESEETPQQTDIKVTQEWIDANVAKDAEKSAVMARLEQNVDEANPKSLKVWEAYVLGLDATDPDAAVKVEKTAGAEEDKAIVVSTVQAPPPDSGFKVTYSLDKIDKTTEEPIDEAHKGEPQESKDLKIDLEPKDDTPTGYYKMNVIVTPDGAEKGEKYPAENTIGVLKVESEEKLLPVAVPWVSLTDGQPIMPDEIVDPRTLSEGDILHVYQKEGEVYSNWYVKDGKWQTMPTLKVAANDQQTLYAAEAMKEGSVARGVGVWLERKDTSKPIYITGQYKADAAPVQIEKPAEGEKPKYNLIAPTGIEQEETDLNGVASLTSDNVSDKDQLMMVRNGVPTYFRFDTTSKKWYYNRQVYVVKDGKTVGVKTKKVFDDAKVPVGIGLWYISGGGNPSIDWKSEEAK